MKAMKGYLVRRRLRSAMRTGGTAEQAVQLLQALMRQLQESVDQAELVHHLERRRMHGVAAEVAEEIRMLLQHHDIDAGAPEEIAEHHARRSAADDATPHLQRGALGTLQRIGFHGRVLLHEPSILCSAASKIHLLRL
ncbi:hypothetical protein ACVWZK_005831 [Bradyrhizobium sp. GM0.4]